MIAMFITCSLQLLPCHSSPQVFVESNVDDSYAEAEYDTDCNSDTDCDLDAGVPQDFLVPDFRTECT